MLIPFHALLFLPAFTSSHWLSMGTIQHPSIPTAGPVVPFVTLCFPSPRFICLHGRVNCTWLFPPCTLLLSLIAFLLLASSSLSDPSLLTGRLTFSGLASPAIGNSCRWLFPLVVPRFQSGRALSVPTVLISIHLLLSETPLFLLRPLNVQHTLYAASRSS